MVKTILALLTALAVAIPSIWAISRAWDKKKSKKTLEKAKDDLAKKIRDGNVDGVADTLNRILHS